MQDYDEVLPPGNEPNSVEAGVGQSNWEYTIDPYIKSGVASGFGDASSNGIHRSVFVCPDYELSLVTAQPASRLGEQNPYGTAADNYVGTGAAGPQPSRSYAANWNIVGSLGSGSNSYYSLPLVVSKIQYPTQTVLVSEERGEAGVTGGNDTNDYTSNEYTDTITTSTSDSVFWGFEDGASYVSARNRHSGGSNYLFTDGHIKWYRAPSPNYQADNQTPVESRSGIVYRRSQFPTASGWFRED